MRGVDHLGCLQLMTMRGVGRQLDKRHCYTGSAACAQRTRTPTTPLGPVMRVGAVSLRHEPKISFISHDLWSDWPAVAGETTKTGIWAPLLMKSAVLPREHLHLAWLANITGYADPEQGTSRLIILHQNLDSRECTRGGRRMTLCFAICLIR